MKKYRKIQPKRCKFTIGKDGVKMSEGNQIHMSKSQLIELINFPTRYRKKRIDKITTLPSVYSSKGNAFHRVMENYFNRVKEDGFRLNLPELCSRGTRFFVEQWSRNVEYQKPISHLEKYGLQDDPKGMAKLRGVYHNELMAAIKEIYPMLEKIKPVAVELPYTISIKLPSGEILKLVVIIDLLCDYDYNVVKIEEYEVENVLKSGKLGVPKKKTRLVETGEVLKINSIDWKISGRAKTQRDVDTDIGLILSAIVMSLEYGKLPENVSLVNIVAKTSSKKLETTVSTNILHTKITKDDVNVMIARVQSALQMVLLGCYPPCPDSFGCGLECPYYSDCEFIFRKDENQLEDLENV